MLKLGVALAVLTLANVAAAIPVTWEAHGVVREVVLGDQADSSTAGALTDLGVTVGEPFSVRVSFDSDATIYPDPIVPGVGVAVGISDMEIDFPHWSLTPPVGPVGSAGAIVLTRAYDASGDPYASSIVFAGNFVDETLSFPESPSRTVTVYWGFLSDDPNFFSNTALPVSPPDLAALPPYRFEATDTTTALGPVLYLTNDLQTKVFDVAAEITSVTLVPEPGAGLLALIAAALLISSRG